MGEEAVPWDIECGGGGAGGGDSVLAKPRQFAPYAPSFHGTFPTPTPLKAFTGSLGEDVFIPNHF